jgi:signal transduction histidine kinase
MRRALVASFAAIAVVFGAGLAATHAFVARIRAAAVEISGNSAPTIASLSSMRSTLRQLQVAAGEHLETCGASGCAGSPARLDGLRDELHGAWQRYRLLPTFPGEADLWPRVDADLARLGEALAVALEAARAGRRDDALERLRDRVAPACDRLDAAIARIVESDRSSGLASAARIEALAGLAVRASAAVALLTVALTLLTAVLAIRVVHRYESSLRDRSDDLEQFAGRVAHDLKAPLGSAGAAFQAARTFASGPAREALDRGLRGLQRVHRLVDDLLDFARAGALDPRGGAADVHDVVEGVVGDLGEVAAESGVEVRVETLARERVACSRGVLASIVQHLVRNAIARTGDGDVRVVRVRALPPMGARRVRIEVEDSGPGIPDALGERVFDPLSRGTEAGGAGSGLGLATVKRFVSAHGGRVGFRPTAGRGTLFWLEMPRPPARRGHPAARA